MWVNLTRAINPIILLNSITYAFQFKTPEFISNYVSDGVVYFYI